jgi:hypothetical protein
MIQEISDLSQFSRVYSHTILHPVQNGMHGINMLSYLLDEKGSTGTFLFRDNLNVETIRKRFTVYKNLIKKLRRMEYRLPREFAVLEDIYDTYCRTQPSTICTM